MALFLSGHDGSIILKRDLVNRNYLKTKEELEKIIKDMSFKERREIGETKEIKILNIKTKKNKFSYGFNSERKKPVFKKKFLHPTDFHIIANIWKEVVEE